MLKNSVSKSRENWQPCPLVETPSDRRIQARVSGLGLRSMLREGELFERVQTVDVSLAGAQVQVSRPLEIGASVALNLNLSGQMVSLRGEVMWNRPDSGSHRLGLRFESMLRADERSLGTWISRHSR